MSRAEVGGVYRHFRNRKLYTVLKLGLSSEDLTEGSTTNAGYVTDDLEAGEIAVIYADAPAEGGPVCTYVRPRRVFEGVVRVGDAEVERFERVR